MSDFLLLLIFGVCWTWGFRTPFQGGFFLEKIGNFFRTEDESSPPEYFGNWFTKPLFDCPPCMASVHGFFISVSYYSYFGGWNIILTIAYIICLCGVNFIIKSILYPEYE